MKTKLLDCTIRDGGHLNGWNFDDECVKNSYISALNAGASYFEIGYRFHNPKKEYGKYAYCDDKELLSLLELDDKCQLSIMIDAGKSESEDFSICKKNITPIKLVRIATYPDKLDIAFKLCEDLSLKGYDLFLNFMVMSEYKKEDFEKISNWKNKDIILSACFADSFGTFTPIDIENFYNKLKHLGFKNVSFHSHNNLQLAFTNTIKAIEKKFYSIDASIYGMGRGAGNLPAELITGYLNKTGHKEFNPLPYIKMIKKYYINLKEKTPWGYDIEPLIGSLKNIHPYYVKGLFEEKNTSLDRIWDMANIIKKNAPISFNKQSLEKILCNTKDNN